MADMASAMSISSHNRRRHSVNGEPSVPRPLHGRVPLTRRQAKEMIHNWDQQIVRLRHRVEELEGQNEELRDLLKDAVRICDEAIAAGRGLPRPRGSRTRIAPSCSTWSACDHNYNNSGGGCCLR